MAMCSVNESIRAQWLRRPLCRRYVIAVFVKTQARLRGAGADSIQAMCWALGSLHDGEQEILGAWTTADGSGAIPAETFGDLYTRGAEFIDIGIGNCMPAGGRWAKPFRHGDFVASVEQTLACVGALVPPRHRELVISCLREVADANELDAACQELTRFQRTALGERYPGVVELWSKALARFESLFALPESLRHLVRSADRTAMDVQERLTRAIHRHGPFGDSASALEFLYGALLRAEQGMDRQRAAARVAGGTGPRAPDGGFQRSHPVVVPALT